jgi:simple sugar transport system permease protein
MMALWQGNNVSRIGLVGFVLSGTLAGLAGTIEVLGPNGRLVSGFEPAHGFTSILTALVANLSVSATAVAAIFFGGLAAAALYLPVIVGLPAAAIDMMNAAFALFVTARAWPRPLNSLFLSRRDGEVRGGEQ